MFDANQLQDFKKKINLLEKLEIAKKSASIGNEILKKNYKINIKSGSITDFFGNSNEPLFLNLKTKTDLLNLIGREIGQHLQTSLEMMLLTSFLKGNSQLGQYLLS